MSYFQQLLIVCPFVFFGAFVDSICGGGGLITLPAYSFASLPMSFAIATNKLSSTPAAMLSAFEYARNKKVDKKTVALAIVPVMIASSVGAYTAHIISDLFLRYFLLVLMPILGIFVFFKDRIKKTDAPKKELNTRVKTVICILIGAATGFYDGFFGPGTGLFMTLAFLYILHLESITSAGTARFLNAISGLFSFIQFVIMGSVNFRLGLPALAFGMLGSFIGSRLTLKNGSRVMKPVMLFVIFALFIKLLLEL